MNAATTDRIAEIREALKGLHGNSSEAKALSEELKKLEQGEALAAAQKGPRVVLPADLMGGSLEELTGQKSAFYWCGLIPVGQKPDPMDPTQMAMIDAPEISPYPPQWCSIVAGISFPQFIEPVSRRSGDAGEQLRSRLWGEVHSLRDEQVERIVDELPRHYIKWHDKFRTTKDADGNRRRVNQPYGQSVILRSAEYIEEANEDAKAQKRRPIILQDQITPGMENIAQYLYMVKVAASNGRLPELPQPISALGIEMP